MENLSNLKDLLKNYYYFQQSVSTIENDFVDKLFELHFKNKKFRKLHLYRVSLDSIVANLIRCGNVDKCLVRPEPNYTHSHLVTPEWYTTHIFYNIFQILVEEGYCDEVKGYPALNGKPGYSGKFIPTEKLKSLDIEIQSKKPDTFIFMNKRDKNHKKNKKRHPVTPPNNRVYKKMDKDIRLINDVIGKADVRFNFIKQNRYYDSDSVGYNIDNYLNTKRLYLVDKDEYQIDLDSMYLKRVFNRNDYMYGGRFYTPVYIGIPRDFRSTITIDGEATVELDYSAHHIRLLYHQDNIDFTGEAYVYNKGDKEHSNERELHKSMAMIAINATSRKSTIKATLDKIRTDQKKGKFTGQIPTYDQLDKLYNEFLEYHKPIAHHVSNDEGAKLQRIDSDIINEILVDLAKDNIVGLPVHDSIIVKKKHKDILKDLMIKHYTNHKKLNKFNPIID